MESMHVLTFSDIQPSSTNIKASIYIALDSTWRPNVEKDRVKLLTNGIVDDSQDFFPPIYTSQVEDNHFTIEITSVQLSRNNEYRLVYLDKDNIQRGASSTFTCEYNEPRSFTSSGSFEAVSDDELSFTVINAEDISISKNWEITSEIAPGRRGSSDEDSNSTTESEDSDPGSGDLNLSPKQLLSQPKPMIKLEDSPNITAVAYKKTSVDISAAGLKSSSQGKTGTSTVHSSDPQMKVISPAAYMEYSKDEVETVDYLQQEETGASTMSKSAVLGGEQVSSQTEIRSLQTRNRALFKKVKKLSELLDNEKNTSSELLQQVIKATTDNGLLIESLTKVRQELDSANKKLKKSTKECNEKDALIAALRKEPVPVLHHRAAEPLLPSTSTEEVKTKKKIDHHSAARYVSVNKPNDDQLPKEDHITTSKTNSANEQAIDKSCGIGIARPRKNHHYDHKERESSRYHRPHRHHRSDHHSQSRYSPRRQQQQQERVADRDHQLSELQGGNSNHRCPVCDRQMPSSLTERQMTLHVESCLRKREA